jgi:hypothetical protein
VSWSDAALLVSALAACVGALAACVAVLFAWRTVQDARRFHEQAERERQLDGLLAVTRTVAEVADTAVRIGNGAEFEYGLLHAQQQRLKVELAALPGFDLPTCREATLPPDPSHGGGGLREIVGPIASKAQNALPELEAAVQAHLSGR